MWILISAIVTASLLGSMHCVGMCGPLAIWASGTGDRISGKQMALATTLYHFGRLLTYALAGLLAGVAGQLLDIGGQALGVQLLAARMVGGLMIVFGILRLSQLALARGKSNKGIVLKAAPPTSLITGLLLKLRPYVFRLPVAIRGLATGLLTALLPCGWLYLFALVAAGTGSLVMGSIVMIAFWVGTVPALVGLVTGTQVLAQRFRKVIPVGAAVLLIVGGCYTASGRGFASLNSLSDIRLSGTTEFANVTAIADSTNQHQIAVQVKDALTELTRTELPCCAADASQTDTTGIQVEIQDSKPKLADNSPEAHEQP